MDVGTQDEGTGGGVTETKLRPGREVLAHQPGSIRSACTGKDEICRGSIVDGGLAGFVLVPFPIPDNESCLLIEVRKIERQCGVERQPPGFAPMTATCEPHFKVASIVVQFDLSGANLFSLAIKNGMQKAAVRPLIGMDVGHPRGIDQFCNHGVQSDH